jgi:divalent metal cation (Fe/Co/Zn/Cd) transporter
MSTPELTVTPSPPQHAVQPRDPGWMRAARQAKWLAWASLAWMGIEGGVGIFAGVQAHSLGVVTWAASSFVEALASLIVVWRFTGHRTLSHSSEARAQRWVAVSFFLLAPYFVIEAVRKLIGGEGAEATVLAIALTSSAVVLMPLLGLAKLRLGRRLGSGATAGEGTQNLLCAGQALAALIAVAGSGAGLWFLDPLAALAIAGIALHEGLEGWRGEPCCDPAFPELRGECEDDCAAHGR